MGKAVSIIIITMLSIAAIFIGVIIGVSHSALSLMPDVKGTFSLVTPTGNDIFNTSKEWMSRQIRDDRLTKEATCAMNVSYVLSKANPEMGGKYSSAWAPQLPKKIREQNGVTVQLKKSKAEIIAGLNNLYSGRIPVGSILSACYSQTCSNTEDHQTGARHVAIIGETIGNKIFVHHNNYFRPMHKGEKHNKWMISQTYLNRGIYRQWQRSPWIEVIRDQRGKIIDFKVISPPMLRILNPYEAFITVAVPQEIAKEIKEGKAFSIDANGRYQSIKVNHEKEQNLISLLTNPWAAKPLVHNTLLSLQEKFGEKKLAAKK